MRTDAVNIEESPVRPGVSGATRYAPYAGGRYSVEPRLAPLQRDTGHGSLDTRVFQLTGDAGRYLANKRACMKENPAKYYLVADARAETMDVATRTLAEQLEAEWGIGCSAASRDPFHDLAMRVPEDVCIVQVGEDCDRLVAAHVCAPSHWAPADKVGKSFAEIHAPVPGIETVSANAPRLTRAVGRGRYKRLGWSLTVDDRLNHHPNPPHDFQGSAEAWAGKTFDPRDPKLFVRIERQTLIGLPEVSAFVFTIRVHFRDCSYMDREERPALTSALLSMTPETRVYKGIDSSFDAIVAWLKRD